jgi:hypothetical protein
MHIAVTPVDTYRFDLSEQDGVIPRRVGVDLLRDQNRPVPRS